MATRSPWRDLKISIRFGSELPPLLRHDLYPTTLARLKWRPITLRSEVNKPAGGLWTAPAILPEGKWRPIPRRSTWTEWCELEDMQTFINYSWQTQVFPDPTALFAVIDTAADAAALYEAFPSDDNPIAALMKEHGMTGGLYSKMIDWQRLLSTGIAGVYLTDRGQGETRLPDTDVVPSLYGWDMATVWFGRRAFRVGKTRVSPRLPVEPEDDLPPRAYFARNSERIAQMAAELQAEGDEPATG